jgi:serine/threonine protein kinase/class 3 adenylate cyclase
MKIVKDPRLVSLLEVGLLQDPPFAAFDQPAGNRLDEALSDHLPLTFAQAMTLITQLTEGVKSCHRVGLGHGKLGPSAIYLDAQWNAQIDIGRLATCLDSDSPFDQAFLAPEPFKDGVAGFPVDVFSLGALWHWLLAGKVRSPSDPSPTLDWLAGECAFILPMLKDMLASDPADRPSAQTVCDWLKAVGGASQVLNNTVDAPSESLLDSAIGAPQAPPTIRGDGAANAPITFQATQADNSEWASAGFSIPNRGLLGTTLGRYRILDELGQGGMGAVYRAEDITDGKVVALKVLKENWSSRPQALKRFHKEARLLGEVNNPYVTNLLEVNEDRGIHYLILEYVAGKNLGRLLAEHGPLEEKAALCIMADVARALADAHERQIVHRDIKPENILLTGDHLPDDLDATLRAGIGSQFRTVGFSDGTVHVKLSDFGLARHVIESESLDMTQAGSVLGTPIYMAPEQCRGEKVDPRTDVYAMGVTLFHLLAGRPPFVSTTAVGLVEMHCKEPPPPLQSLNAKISDGACQVVEKALAKAPDARYPNASALLRDLERLLRGEPANIVVHPILPVANSANVLKYDWTWELESSPRELWPHVSNTERLNRAVGMAAVHFEDQTPSETAGAEVKGVKPRTRRFGSFQRMGITAAWEEHPFEWIEARRMGVLREYSRGPFKWLVSITELTPRLGGGTLLAHRVRIEPHGLVGRTIAAVEVGIKGKNAVDRVYRRIDAALSGKLGGGADSALVDPFEEPTSLKAAQSQRLEELLDKLSTHGIDPTVLERLGDFIRVGSPQEVARIRPLALARRLGVECDDLVVACLQGAREGLLVLLWDILCPICRIPAQLKETLRQVESHGHCPACVLDFEIDFANSVEMIFRTHGAIRETELGTYCVGGPAHSPHVAAQVRLSAGESFDLDLSLDEGAYRIRGPQLPQSLEFRVQPDAPRSRWQWSLANGLPPGYERALRNGSQQLSITNDFDQEVIVRVERIVSREDALTAAQAANLALFRELFPGEVVSTGQCLSVSDITILVIALVDAGQLYESFGDQRAFQLINEFFKTLENRIGLDGGALIKSLGEGIVATFSNAAAAVRAAVNLAADLKQSSIHNGDNKAISLGIRAGIHRGPAMATTINNHLDYFGVTVHQVMQILFLSRPGELVMSSKVAADVEVAAFLGQHRSDCRILQADLPCHTDAVLHGILLDK